MKLVVGLGNPGKKYEGTRHNIGWEVIAKLAHRHAASGPSKKFEGEVCETNLSGQKLLILAPHTYMNLSGRSVQQAASFYKLETTDLLVVCDDFHLPVGELRIRARGSAGGQNGLANIATQLKTDEYARLRVGIGPVPDNWKSPDFVLGKFNEKERPEMDLQVERAADAIETWVLQGVASTMNQYNGKAS